MYIPAFSTKLWFSRIYLFAVFTYKVRHRSGSRAHQKKILNFVQNQIDIVSIIINVEHNRMKCFPENCNHIYQVLDRYNICKNENKKYMQGSLQDHLLVDRAAVLPPLSLTWCRGLMRGRKTE